MRTFLHEVAISLYDRYGDDISSLTIVMPSRRAGLFFCDTLSDMALRPLWQPKFMSVNEIMQSVSGLTVCDNIKLVSELYKIYSKYHAEPFDSFYFWGEMLLADFDQIDKYFIDADMLFSNIRDLKELENHTYLTSEQIDVITQFWSNFDGGKNISEEKERFWEIWSTLGTVYHEYRAALLDSGLAYEGLVQRVAVEKIVDGTLDAAWLPASAFASDKYVIVGFNALTECEKRVFGWLEKGGRAEFFWDYDYYYTGNPENEAGLFLRDNIRRFPPFDARDITHNHFTEVKDITVVSAPSDVIQAKYVYTFLKGLLDAGLTPGKETAIVLTDESLLLPVLHSIPEEIESINITMGYPLRQTTAYSFMERLLALQTRRKSDRNGNVSFYHSDVAGILEHAYIREEDAENVRSAVDYIKRANRVYVTREKLGEMGFDALFGAPATWIELVKYIRTIISDIGSRQAADRQDNLRREFFAVIIDAIDRVENSLVGSGLEITVPVFTSLLRKILQNTRIPYTGEPLEGIQIMGILETRNLDFENVLILSANDDTFPGGGAVSSSFIPYNLRYAYGLPTPQHHEGVYAYYFYRLMQRSSKVDIVYSSLTDDKKTGEPSRYIYQLDYESPHELHRTTIPLDVNISPADDVLVINKGPGVMEKLDDFRSGGGRSLSPTALHSYVECPAKFYFRYIAGIAVEDEISEEIDAPIFGTILHKAMELLYNGLQGVLNPQASIRGMMDSGAVEAAVDEAIRSEYLNEKDIAVEEYGGEVLLVREIVIRYIKNGILPFDAGQEGSMIVSLEYPVDCEIAGVSFRGIADRIDRLENGLLRVIDYKTGARRVEFASVESLFSEVAKERASAVFQTMLYSLMLWNKEGSDVQPALYHVRYMNSPGFSPLLVHAHTPVERFSDYSEEFAGCITSVLTDLFDSGKPFMQCSDTDTCQYCDYKAICRK